MITQSCYNNRDRALSGVYSTFKLDSPKPSSDMFATSPSIIHLGVTMLPVITTIPADRLAPRSDSVFASHTSASRGWPITSEP